MRIVSFNIKRGYESSIKQVADAMCKLDPDICLIQEVDRFVSRSKFVDQHRCIKKRCGFDKGYFFKTKSINAFGKYGHTLYLKNVRHTKPETITLTAEAQGEKRVAFITHIYSNDGQDFTLAGTHLSVKHSQAEKQLDEILRILRRQVPEDSAFILAGDFNLEPDALKKYGIKIEDTQCSCGIPTRTVRCDYVIGQGLNLQAHVVHLPGISDHDPVIADID